MRILTQELPKLVNALWLFHPGENGRGKSAPGGSFVLVPIHGERA